MKTKRQVFEQLVKLYTHWCNGYGATKSAWLDEYNNARDDESDTDFVYDLESRLARAMHDKTREQQIEDLARELFVLRQGLSSHDAFETAKTFYKQADMNRKSQHKTD